jgi:hypothetical protein
VSINNFSQNDSAIIAPFTRAVAITPSDTEDLAEITRGLNVHKGTGGSTTSINVLLSGDAEPVIMTFQVGFVIPLRIRRVYATGTDATVIVGLY